LAGRAIPAILAARLAKPSFASALASQGIDMTPIRLVAATTRRLRLLAPAGLLALALAAGSALAQSAPATPAPAATAAADALTAPVPLPDIAEGSPNAPVTIVEFASMTCSHCAAFQAETWPALKAKYVDAGKVKFVLREFPFDPLAAAAFMVARCAGPEKRNAVVDQLFAQQKTWAFVEEPVPPLRAIATQFGLSQADFETCLDNQALYQSVKKSKELAAQRLGVDSTPTFFVNGQKLEGAHPIADFDAIIQPLLK